MVRAMEEEDLFTDPTLPDDDLEEAEDELDGKKPDPDDSTDPGDDLPETLS